MYFYNDLNQLTFKYHPLHAVLQQASTIVPGALRIVAVYYDEQNTEWNCKEFNVKNETIESINLDEHFLNQHRGNSNNRIWINNNELGIKSDGKKVVQLSLEDELDNNTLLLKFSSQLENQFDLLFIQFNKDKNNFELESKPQPLGTANKSVIGHLLNNAVTAFINTHNHNKHLFEQIIKSNNTLHANLVVTKKQLKASKDQIRENLVLIIKDYTKNIPELQQMDITFDDDVIEKLEQFNGSNSELKKVLLKGLEIAINLSFNDQVCLRADHLVLDSYLTKNDTVQQKVNTTATSTIPFDRYSKTQQLLDRYEKAARKLKGEGLSLTGKNLGAACAPAISAPAITDAVKKHKNKILTLLQKYPDSWAIIRNEFKPITNLYQRNEDLGKFLLGA